jgi:hypothetical protein
MAEADQRNDQENALRGNWLPPPRLPKFSGDDRDGPFEDYAREVERVVRAYQLPGAISAELVIRNLEGQARTEVVSLPNDRRQSSEQILTHLRSVFSDKRPLVLLLEDFNRRQQQEGESVLQFSHALQNLADRCNTSRANSVPPEIVRDRFSEKLLDPALRQELRRLRRSTPDATLAQLREEAMNWARDPPLEPVFARAQSASAPTDRLDKLEQQMENLVNLLQNALPQRLEAAQVPRWQRTCWKCKKPGHIQRHCPSLAEN